MSQQSSSSGVEKAEKHDRPGGVDTLSKLEEAQFQVLSPEHRQCFIGVLKAVRLLEARSMQDSEPFWNLSISLAAELPPP